MRVAPVSADLLIKLALVALVVGGGVYLVRRAGNAIGDALPDFSGVGAWVDSAANFAGDVGNSVGEGAGWVADTFGGAAHNTDPATLPQSAWLQNPYGIYLSPDQQKVYDNQVSQPNPVYRGVNAVGGAITGTRDFSLGSWIYDLVNPEPVFTPFNPDPVQDIRRIDNALGY